MSKFRVLQPVTYVQGKKAILHRRPDDRQYFEIEDAVASKLGDRVQRIGAEDKADDKAASGKQAGKQ